MPVVGREGEALGVRGRDERQEVVEVLRGRSLADPDVHPAAHLLVRLGAREALVVRADARADVGVQVEAGEERRVAVDRDAAGGARPPPSRRRRGRRRGSPGRSSSRRGRGRSAGRRAARGPPPTSVGPGRLEMRRRDARRQHDEDVDREARGRRRGRRGCPATPRTFAISCGSVTAAAVPCAAARRANVRRRRHRGLDVEVRVPERGGDEAPREGRPSSSRRSAR